MELSILSREAVPEFLVPEFKVISNPDKAHFLFCFSNNSQQYFISTSISKFLFFAESFTNLKEV